jgi:hypothetical protein
MFRPRSPKAREQRAQAYLTAHPDDATAVEHALKVLRAKPKASAEEIAEKYAGHPIDPEQWKTIAWRWERIWQALAEPEK